MSKAPKRERKLDHYYSMAKQVGYRARSSFKLRHLDRRYKLFRRGDVVVDIGAAPGGWLQVARERVGAGGFVLGVDLQRISKLQHENVRTLVADITDPSAPELIRQNLPRPATVVISDASPKISGVWDVDHYRSIALAHAALSVAGQVLAPSGKFITKVFQGGEFEDFLTKVRQKFNFVKISKPPASRKSSAEVYIIARDLKDVS